MQDFLIMLGSSPDQMAGMVLVLVFVATVSSVAGVGYWLFSGNTALQRRLNEIESGKKLEQKAVHREGQFSVKWVTPVANVIAPSGEWKKSHLRRRLVRAGLRSHHHIQYFLASKVLLVLTIPPILMTTLIMSGVLDFKSVEAGVTLFVSAACSYLLPDLLVLDKTQKRQLDLAESFPDALDLLVVCVEAGLALDAAIQRVSKELAHSHPVLADELAIVNLEMRAGKDRNDAMRDLSERTGLDDFRSLVSILIQAENFGTSVAKALREHADEMRLIRMQKAREKAAKLPVTLLFPILLFIFPAIFLVVLGPAAVRIYLGFVLGL